MKSTRVNNACFDDVDHYNRKLLHIPSLFQLNEYTRHTIMINVQEH